MPRIPDGGTPIVVTPALLHNLAEQFRQAAEDIATQLGDLKNSADGLSASWSGKSHDAFEKLWNRSYNVNWDLIVAMDDIARALDQAAGYYDESNTPQTYARGGHRMS